MEAKTRNGVDKDRFFEEYMDVLRIQKCYSVTITWQFPSIPFHHPRHKATLPFPKIEDAVGASFHLDLLPE